MSLLRRSSARWLLQHPWPAGLSLLGIALGIAVVAGMDLAIGSARRAFLASAEAVGGRATHHVIGGPAGLPDSTYARVRGTIVEAAPIVEAYARAPDFPGRTFRILGVDPFAEAPFRSWVATGSGLSLAPLLTHPGSVVLGLPLAMELGLSIGDTLALVAGGEPRRAVVMGLVEPEDALARTALADVLLADIATAQELAGTIGRITRIDLRMTAEDSAHLAAVLPPGTRIVGAGERVATTAAMTRAFEVNLTALSLLALIFGIFLVYNAVTFSVLRRRPLIALERAIGVTRDQVVARVVGEAVVIGALATLLGFALGILLARGLVGLVARTINDLHFALTVSELRFGPGAVLRALLLGTLGSALAALPAAVQAARMRPGAALLRSALEQHVRARTGPLLFGGLALAGAGVVVALTPGAGLGLGFAGLFALIGGAALLAPAITLGIARLLRPAATFVGGAAGSHAARGVASSLSRTGPAIAALAVAVGAVLAVGTVVGSFRSAVESWLAHALRADVYVSVPGALSNRAEGTLDPIIVERVRALPLAEGVTTFRNVVLPHPDGDLRISAVDLHPPHRAGFDLIEGDPVEAWRAFDAGGLLVTESLAFRRGLHPGSMLILPTQRGDRPFEVAAVFRDYTTEHGLIFIDRAAYDANWDDAGVTSLGVFARPRVSTDSLIAALRALAPTDAAVNFTRTRDLRAGSLAVFDRTFAITMVLRALALVVALVGVLGALMALQLERTRELGVLRALGLTPRGLGAVVAGQTAVMGVAAAVLGLPLGAALGALMLEVVNRRSFGWSVPFQLDANMVAQSAAVAIVAALVAGAYPAWRMARTRPAEALRGE